jgi:hypothetical protein
MADVFGRNVSELGGVFASDRAKLIFALDQAGGAGGDGAPFPFGAVVQQMQFRYAQTITRLYEVGGKNVYLVGGRTQGDMTVQRVIGPKASMCRMWEKYGNVCNARKNTITLDLADEDCSAEGAAGSAHGASYTMKNSVVTQVGAAVAAQDMVINETTTVMFTSLECTPRTTAISESPTTGLPIVT